MGAEGEKGVAGGRPAGLVGATQAVIRTEITASSVSRSSVAPGYISHTMGNRN